MNTARLIDSHVHIAQPAAPGIVMADDFASATRAAAFGGPTNALRELGSKPKFSIVRMISGLSPSAEKDLSVVWTGCCGIATVTISIETPSHKR